MRHQVLTWSSLEELPPKTDDLGYVRTKLRGAGIERGIWASPESFVPTSGIVYTRREIAEWCPEGQKTTVGILEWFPSSIRPTHCSSVLFFVDGVLTVGLYSDIRGSWFFGDEDYSADDVEVWAYAPKKEEVSYE
jgi:hypothetical protein